MRDYSAESGQLCAICKGLLASGAVELVLAWTSGPGLTGREAMIAKGADQLIDRIVWSPFCTSSIATLIKRNRKALEGKNIGIVVKDCDRQALNVLLQEYVIKKENVVIIGVRCDGLASALMFPDATMASKVVSDEKGVQVDGKEVAWEDFGFNACLSCRYDSMSADHVVGEYARKKQVTELPHLKRLSGLSLSGRKEHFDALFGRCIRCYACREVCPVCACIECAIDPGESSITPRTTPLEKTSVAGWACRGREPSENAVFLMTRAMHMAGRCVRCGWCERACPAGIPLMELLDIVNENVLRVYKYEAGKDPAAPPFLASFSDDDPDDSGGAPH